MNEADRRYIKMKDYLESIGGLKNGFYSDREPITDPRFFAIGIGWYPLVYQLIAMLIADGWNKEICQVKEKFGGLRFYTNSLTELQQKHIDRAEAESFKICEQCGAPGKCGTSHGWLLTLCEQCRENEDKVRF